MKYQQGDIILTISDFEEEEQMDIEQYLSREYRNRVAIILKVNRSEAVYTVMFAGVEAKKYYIKEYLIKEKL